MRIQHLAVIFVIIILPISMVVSLYTGNLIKVANTEAAYNKILANSTYDAVRAYQMNTLDNTYADEDTSKIRDVNASVNSFFNSLATGMQLGGYGKDELQDYVPALIFTLYDGFYTYTPYENIGSNTYVKLKTKKNAEAGYNSTSLGEQTGDQSTGGLEIKGDDANTRLNYYNTDTVLTDKPEYGIKNLNYYSCEYKGNTKDNGKYDIIIDYTLDNYIRIYGTVDGKFYNYQGYYIYTDNITYSGTSSTNATDFTVKQIVNKDDGTSEERKVEIEPERLGEYIAYYDTYTTAYPNNGGGYSNTTLIYQKEGSKGINYFNYIIYNGVKYYLDYDHIGLTTPSVEDTYSLTKTYNVGNDYINSSQYQLVNILMPYTDPDTKQYSTTYNFSFNKTYTGIPIFRLDKKQRIYISDSELKDICSYLYGYYQDHGLVASDQEGGIDTIKTTLLNNWANYYKDLNDVFYYRNAYFFSKAANDNIFSKIILNLNKTDANYSVVSDAYNTDYSVYFQNDSTEGKSSDTSTSNGNTIVHEKHDFSKYTSDENGVPIFHSWGTNGATEDGSTIPEENVNPDLDASLFNEHRMDVIISCIEASLVNSVCNFNEYINSTYQYKIPTISESDWGKITNNLTCTSFMQGMAMGNYKFYNNYSVVVDNKVNEFTPKNSIYVERNINDQNAGLYGTGTGDVYKNGIYTLNDGTSENLRYHKPGCAEFNELAGNSMDVIGYRIIDYDIDSYSLSGDMHTYIKEYTGSVNPDGGNKELQTVYFYLRPGSGCYNCVVSQNKLDISIDDLLNFRDKASASSGANISNNVRQAYFRALARERGAKSRFSGNIDGKKTFGQWDG